VVATSRFGAPEMTRFSMKSTPRLGANFSPVGVLLPRAD